MERKSIRLSNSSLNRNGFRVLTSGVDLEAFKANPVMLYMHRRGTVIGKWENIRVDGDDILADPVFDAEHELGAQAERQWKAGFLNTASLGVHARTFSEEPKDMLPGQVYPTFLTSEVFEASLVDVPGNRESVTLAAAAGDVALLHAHTTLDLSTLPSKGNQPNDMTDEQLLALRVTLGMPETASFDDLNAEVSRLRNIEVDSLLSVGEAKGLVTEDNREHYRKLASADAASLQSLFAAAPATTPSVSTPKATGNSLAATIKDAETLAAKDAETLAAGKRKANAVQVEADNRESWGYEDWSKNDPEGLAQLKAETPDVFAELATKFQAKHTKR